MSTSPQLKNASDSNASRLATWSPIKRHLATAAISFHLIAIAVAPWSTPPPASQLSESAAYLFRPYLLATHLNHGYRFFAPNPGPSHIIRYELKGQGGEVKSGQIPDPAIHWPRLLYHRHFMMTESLFNNWTLIERVPEGVQLEPDQERQLNERNEFAQRLVQMHAQGMANRLLERHGGDQVKLTLVEHLIPYPPDVANGQRLDDERLYIVLDELGVFTRQEQRPSRPEELP